MSFTGQLSLPLRLAGWVGAFQDLCRPSRSEKAALPSYGDLFDWKHGITVRMLQNRRARRYLLRLQPDGEARLIAPSRGNRAEALRFLERQELWLQQRHDQWRVHRQPWTSGQTIFLRGEEAVLQIEQGQGRAVLRFADQAVAAVPGSDYRQAVQRRLRNIAKLELTARTWELARIHQVKIERVSIRAQRTRWGSCSSRGTISLNWKLIQAPPFVQDYLIIHELMHRREMNHSRRFWKWVAEACPGYQIAEKWLKTARLDELG